jgi:hypothetical protein
MLRSRHRTSRSWASLYPVRTKRDPSAHSLLVGCSLTERKLNLPYVRRCLVVLLLWPLHGQHVSKVTNEEIVRIEAKNDVYGVIGSKRPYVGITCSANKPTVFLANTYPVLLDGRIFYFKSLRIQFDDVTPLSQDWVETKDHSRLYSPTPAAFIKQLPSAKTLRLEWRSSAPVYTPMVFDVSRWASTLANLISGCSF